MSYVNQRFNYQPPPPDSPELADQFAPIPDGWYEAEITNSEVRPTAAGGEGINLEWAICGPAHHGRKVWQWINTKHLHNDEVVKRGFAELGRLCHAMGLPQGIQQSTAETHGRRVMVRLGTKKREGFDPKSEIREVKSRAEVNAPAAAPSAPPQSAPAQPPTPAQNMPPAPPASSYNDDDMPF